MLQVFHAFVSEFQKKFNRIFQSSIDINWSWRHFASKPCLTERLNTQTILDCMNLILSRNYEITRKIYKRKILKDSKRMPDQHDPTQTRLLASFRGPCRWIYERNISFDQIKRLCLHIPWQGVSPFLWFPPNNQVQSERGQNGSKEWHIKDDDTLFSH